MVNKFKPNKNEKKKDFIDKYINDEALIEELPNKNIRYCHLIVSWKCNELDKLNKKLGKK